MEDETPGHAVVIGANRGIGLGVSPRTPGAAPLLWDPLGYYLYIYVEMFKSWYHMRQECVSVPHTYLYYGYPGHRLWKDAKAGVTGKTGRLDLFYSFSAAMPDMGYGSV
jgi:hypothetical protein